MTSPFKQHILDISLPKESTFDNYYVGPNKVVYQHLLASEPKHIFNPTILWGASGVGRTHLLQAVCHAIHQKGWPIAYIPLAEHRRFTPDILQGLEKMGALCWDDIDQVSGLPEWEHALFHAYNRLQAANAVLCVSTTQPIKTLHFTLPDLASRLINGFTFEVKPLSDADKSLVLQERAKSRGFVLSDRVVRYLLYHYSRDLTQLMKALEQLDQASLAKGRCLLSIPFVKEVLA